MCIRDSYTPWQVLEGRVECGGTVAIADWRGDWISLGLAEKLIREGRRVTVCTSAHTPGVSLMPYIRDQWTSDLAKLGVQFVSHARLYGADASDAYFEHTYSGDAIVCEQVDTLIGSFGNATSDAASELGLPGAEMHVIGDALCPRTVEEAVLEGLRVGAGIE